MEGGAQTLQLRKIPNSEIAVWDATHNAAGHLIDSDRSDAGSGEKSALGDSGSDDGKRVHVFVKDDGRV